MADWWHENSSNRFEASRFSKLLSLHRGDSICYIKCSFDIFTFETVVRLNNMFLLPEAKSWKSQKSIKAKKGINSISEFFFHRSRSLDFFHRDIKWKLWHCKNWFVGWVFLFNSCIKQLKVRKFWEMENKFLSHLSISEPSFSSKQNL